ncbi:hypothetical protein [Aquabacterium sp.]|uniref:hypothetical protein n=1 Tax=Aquabacterium sp. TaxID=1872578 RepID=UPI00378496E4
MLFTMLATMAIVTQDQAALRAGARESAAQQAVLWRGDALEVRGRRLDYLQVWDHRRERGGFVRASQVRVTELQPAEAPELLSVLRFVRDTPGAEALGVAYAAAYLQAVPPAQLGPEVFDAIGTLADRLARRAAMKPGQSSSATIAAHLEVVKFYGVAIGGTERDGQLQPCYDGEAFRRVLALPSSAEQRARAALGLTRHDCVDTSLSPVQRLPLDQWRAQVLDQLSAEQFASLPEQTRNQLRLRRAGVWASLAYQQTRRHEPAAAAAAAQRALGELAAVNKTELSDDDRAAYQEAAMRVSASRWAAEAEPTPAAAGLAIRTEAGQPGETCVQLVDARQPQARPLASRCTYGLVWAASARANPAGNALALAVQPLDTWRELWVFRRQGKDWVVDALPPAANGPELGYLEFAGWVPGSDRLLVARESKVEGRVKRSFEVLKPDTGGQAEKSAAAPDQIAAFARWQDPAWKRQTVSLR